MTTRPAAPVRDPSALDVSPVASPSRWLESPLPSLGRDGQYLAQNFRTGLPLWLADQGALALSIWGVHELLEWSTGNVSPTSSLGWWLVLGLAVTLAHLLQGLYPGIGLSTVRELQLVATSLALVLGTLAISIVASADGSPIGVVRLAGVYAVAVILIPAFRRLTRRLVCRFRWWTQPTLVFGGGDEANEAFQSLLAHPHLGLRPVGLVDDLHHHWLESVTDPLWYLGPVCDTHQLAVRHQVFWGVVAMNDRVPEAVAAVIDRFALTVPRLLVLPDFAKFGRHWDGAHDFGGRLGAQITERLILPCPRMLKRGMDLCLGTLGILALAPVMALVALAVRCTSRGPVFFRPLVPGVGGRHFRMWKFRTMHENGEQLLEDWFQRHPEDRLEWDRFHKLKNDPRVTRIGHYLRRSSLDELPQLLNVFLGQMSLVGPRPYPMYECEEMQTKAPLILKVRPGLTGMWQVTGRNHMTFEQRLDVDVAYVRNWSLWMDLAILAKTIVVVVRKTGAY